VVLRIRLARHARQGVTLLLVNPLVRCVLQDPSTQMKENRRARHVPLEHTERLLGQHQLLYAYSAQLDNLLFPGRQPADGQWQN
jgi:hypothetical protein